MVRYSSSVAVSLLMELTPYGTAITYKPYRLVSPTSSARFVPFGRLLLIVYVAGTRKAGHWTARHLGRAPRVPFLKAQVCLTHTPNVLAIGKTVGPGDDISMSVTSLIWCPFSPPSDGAPSPAQG